MIAALGSRGLVKLAQRHGFAQNARLLGVYNFSGSTSEYGQRLSRWLKAAESGDLLMCHVSQTAEPLDLLARARHNEFSVWSSPEFSKLVLLENIRLRPMRKILGLQ